MLASDMISSILPENGGAGVNQFVIPANTGDRKQ